MLCNVGKETFLLDLKGSDIFMKKMALLAQYRCIGCRDILTHVLSFYLFLGLWTSAAGQNTVGLLSWNPERSFSGYHLIYPNQQSTVYLLDACGRIVHQWEDGNLARPGTVAKLAPDGSLFRAKNDLSLQMDPTFGSGGSGGTIEQLTWDGEVVWQFLIADSIKRAHHDIHLMPNGNLLAIVWERKSRSEIIAMGFDTIQNPQQELWSEAIYEIDPTNDSVVWSWHVWDHLVQDFDPSKPGYGDVSGHPGRIHINYRGNTNLNLVDFLHFNAVDYSPILDQIIISVRNFDEIWIIDHSTSKEEAAGSTGGASGRGGELLFRWGNPHAYDRGSPDDRVFFQQHDVQWILEPELMGSEIYGQICLFNNFIDASYSRGQVLFPVFDTISGTYLMDTNGTFLPGQVAFSLAHPDEQLSFSALASSIQYLPNGNVLMCASQRGFAYEITPSGEVVWEYRTPMIFGQRIAQGTVLQTSQNFTNQVERYPLDFQGFEGRDLMPGDYLELNPNPELCAMLTSVPSLEHETISIFPNPAGNKLFIQADRDIHSSFRIYELTGRTVITGKFDPDNKGIGSIDLSGLVSGIYLLAIGPLVKKIVIR